jgi:hypothetical protein
LIWAAVVLVPSTAAAQASISGLVQDASGGVLPGVTVEATSPVLIEKVRSATTDEAGLYRITDLRPGIYTITFTLQGFTTVKRENVEVSGNADFNVPADLKVGTLAETITVSGTAPVVDIQNTLQQTVITKEQLEVLPGGRTIQGRAALVPGVVVTSANTGVIAHGSASTDSHTMIDGYKAGMHLVGRGTGRLGVGSVTQTQEATIEELVYDTGAQGAEYAFSGVRMNMIPKEGSNVTRIETIIYGQRENFEWNNLGDFQNAPLNFKYAPQEFSFDFNPVIGGPIIQNKVWYFGSVSGNRSNSRVLDTYFKPDSPSTPEKCRNRPADNLCLADTGAKLNMSQTVRITHQATPRNKFRYSFDNTRFLTLRGNYTTVGFKHSPEAAWRLPLYPTWFAQGRWTSTLTNRLLLEAGYAYQRGDFRVNYQPENPIDAVAVWDLSQNRIFENIYFVYDNQERKQEGKIALSYVTGSHTLKVGFENRWANAIQENRYNGDIAQVFVIDALKSPANPLGGFRVDVTNGPSRNKMAFNWDGGAYIQDQWRIGRFTLNLGARYDKFNAHIPAQSVPDSNFVKGFSIDRISNTPDWNDWATRTGVAWDVFGTGRTAIKAYAGRFIAGEALSRTAQFNPIYSRQDQRTWTDLNADRKVVNPDGTPQLAEIGAGSANFGSPDTVDKQDPNLKRDKNWTYELGVQHQLMRRVGVFFSYHRRHFFDLAYTDNLATNNWVDANNPGDWIPFTFVGPAHSQLPGGGNEVITLYNLPAGKVPALNPRQGFLTNAPDDYRTYNGVEFGTNVRLPRSGFAMASLTSGKTHIHDCTVDNPNSLRFCDRTTPFRAILKLSGGMPLPYQIMVSSNFALADTPGSGLFLAAPYFAANLQVTSGTAALQGKTLTGGTSATGTQTTVNLLPPNTIFQDYYKIFDMRFSKTMNIGRNRLTALAEFDNIFNMRNVVAVGEAFTITAANDGGSWLRPTTVQRGRNIRFGIQYRY